MRGFLDQTTEPTFIIATAFFRGLPSRENVGPPETVGRFRKESGGVEMKSYTLLGTELQATTYEEFTRFCQGRCREPGVVVVDFSNTQTITKRRHEPEFRNLTSRVDYFIPDGMPLIWCLNRLGAGLADRVYGPTFMRHCVLQSPGPITHYFIGPSDHTLAELRKKLLAANPDLLIIGSQNGYCDEKDEGKIVDEINRLSPDFIWIGLGTPKQQGWVYQYKSSIKRGILFTVGFAFDVNAGTKPDAPMWLQRLGLTWLFRMISEPRRLVPRYVKYNSLFLYYLMRDGLKPRVPVKEKV